MEFKDYFSSQSSIYVKSRPHYPDELFTYLASLVKAHDLAWDCATGNGQAAIPLAKYFKKIIATDGSQPQLNNAMQHERVTYHKALADDSSIESGTVDLVTIAAAIHWLDFDKFYKEVDRVLKPGGIVAAWTYCDSEIDKDIDPIVLNLSWVFLKDYWPAESAYVRNHYKDIPMPFKRIETPEFKTLVNANMEFIIGNLYSWSATQNYMKATGKDPVEPIKKKLAEVWGDPLKTREIR